MPEPPVLAEIRSTAVLAELVPQWWQLWHRTPEASPFQSPAWLLPWWRIFGTDELLTLTTRRGGHLTGLAPLYGLREAGITKLLPLGIGITDYLHPLLPEADGEAVLTRLTELATGFDRVDLVDQRPHSPLLQMKIPAGWSGEVRSCESCPTVTWPAGSPQAAAPRLAKQGYYERRAAMLGEREWVDADADTLPELLSALFALHSSRWSQQGLPGVLVDENVQAFHHLAAPELLSSGLLRLFGLRINGRLVAVFHGLADGRRLYAYLSGYDPALPHPGLGAMLLGRALCTADAEGLRELHFLRGREPYKYAWGGVDRPLYACSLWK